MLLLGIALVLLTLPGVASATTKTSDVSHEATTAQVAATPTSNKIDLSDCTIENIPDQVFSDVMSVPSPSVTLGGKALVEGQDYTTEILNYEHAGTATFVVTGTGDYTGRAKKDFVVTKGSSSLISIVVSAGIATYDGTAHGVSAEATMKAHPTSDETVVWYSTDQATWSKTAPTWVDATDGPITVYIKATNPDCEDAFSQGSISVLPAQLSNVTFADIQDQSWTGAAITPSITATYSGMTLIEGKDYTLSYKGNGEVGAGAAIVTGEGNYVGTTTLAFSIVKGAEASTNRTPATVQETSTTKVAASGTSVASAKDTLPATGDASTSWAALLVMGSMGIFGAFALRLRHAS
jgi:LPXTG-motif cell wall-anchored protein